MNWLEMEISIKESLCNLLVVLFKLMIFLVVRVLQMRIATKGNYENVILVGYIYKDNQSRFLEKDKVIVYGECNGLYTYTSTMGAHITVPSCNAEYIDMN